MIRPAPSTPWSTTGVPPPPQRSASRRYWKPVLGIAGASIGLVAVFFVSVFLFLRNSQPAKLAVQTAQTSPVLIKRIGTPLKISGIVEGNINSSADIGTAKLDIPISGPLGSATLHAEAINRGKVWELTSLNFDEDGGTIPLGIIPTTSTK